MMNTNEMNVSKEEVTMAQGEDLILTEDVRQGLETARDTLEYGKQAVLVSEDIQAMDLAAVEAALAREEALIQDLQAKRAAQEAPYRALTKQTLLLKARKKLAECEEVMGQLLALGEEMQGYRNQEKEHLEVKTQLLERKKELQG